MITEQQTRVNELKETTISRKTLAPRRRVLLVEDDRSLRRYLEVVLRQEGYEVFVATDGIEAIAIILRSPLDVVITDAIMPNLNGYELCRFLRSVPHLSRIPIILLSALEIKEGHDDQKADVCLSKPVLSENLIECLEQLADRAT